MMKRQVTVEILCIGNEILIGEIQDANTAWLCREVFRRGGFVTRVTMLRDLKDEIAESVRSAIERRVAVVFTSGGLGPTADDLTLSAVAAGAGVELKRSEAALKMVKLSYDQLARKGIMTEGGLNPAREKMAWLPEGTEPLHNPTGTAPGVLFKTGQTAIISLPGVPSELKAIVANSLGQFMDDTFHQGGTLSKTIWVRCNDESIIAPLLSRVVAAHPLVYIKSLAAGQGDFPELAVVLSVTGGGLDERGRLMGAALQDLQNGLAAMGIGHREKTG